MKLTIIIAVFLLAYDNKAEELNIDPDIHSINELQSSKNRITIDPKIRKALFNVLNRLERQQPDSKFTSESEKNNYTDPTTTIIVQTDYPTTLKDQDDDIKWEYVSNGAIEEFDFKEALKKEEIRNSRTTATTTTENIQMDEKSTTPDGILITTNFSGSSTPPVEQEALFFKIRTRPQQQKSKKSQENSKNENMITEESSSSILNQPVIDYLRKMITTSATTPSLQSTTVTTRTQTDSSTVIDEENLKKSEEKDEEFDSDGKKKEKHEVEFFQAPLVAAFTLEHDQFGLPKRVRPLNEISKKFLAIMSNKLNQEILHNNLNNNDEDARREQQLRQIQNRPTDFNNRPFLENSAEAGPNEMIEKKLRDIFQKKQQLELEKEKYLLELERRKKDRFNFVDFRQTPSGGQNPIEFQPSLEFFPPGRTNFNAFPRDSGVLFQEENTGPNKFSSNFIPPRGLSEFTTPKYSSSSPKPNFVEFLPSKPDFGSKNYNQFSPPHRQSPPAYVEFPQRQSILEFPSRQKFSENRPNNFAQGPIFDSSTSPNYFESSPSPIYRGHRGEPQAFVQNYEFNNGRPNVKIGNNFDYYQSASTNNVRRPPITVDKLQSLFYQSGLMNNPQHEDFNIITKVLALDHKGNDQNKVSTPNGNLYIRDNFLSESSNSPVIFTAARPKYRLTSPYVSFNRPRR